MIDIQALFIDHPERKLGAWKKILPEEIVMEQQTKLDHIASLVLTLVGLKMQNCWKYLSICFWLESIQIVLSNHLDCWKNLCFFHHQAHFFKHQHCFWSLNQIIEGNRSAKKYFVKNPIFRYQPPRKELSKWHPPQYTHWCWQKEVWFSNS